MLLDADLSRDERNHEYVFNLNSNDRNGRREWFFLLTERKPMYQTRGPVPLLQRAQFKNLFSLDFYSSLILNCVFTGGFAQARPNPLQN